MSKIIENLRYSKDHEWVSVEGDVATVGITDYAQESLGDVVYVELPKEGDAFTAHEAIGSVESVKASAEIYAPASGKVSKVNKGVVEKPELINSDPFGEAWMIQIEDATVSDLMDTAAYEKDSASRSH